MTASTETPYKNILQVQALLRELNYHAGSRNEKKGTEMRNTLTEKNQWDLVTDPVEKRKESCRDLNIIK